MTESAYAFAVQYFNCDPDVRAVIRCDACHGLGEVITHLQYTRSGRVIFADPPIRERCEVCTGTGVERVERRSEDWAPEICRGETRLPILRNYSHR